ncbi:protein of unknown function [Citrobacter freundii]|nr:protein of unknown function [Citrobacter freundii]
MVLILIRCGKITLKTMYCNYVFVATLTCYTSITDKTCNFALFVTSWDIT